MKTPPQQVSDSIRRLNPHLYGIATQSTVRSTPTHFDPPGGVKTPKRIRQSSKPLLNALEREFQAYYEKLTGHTLIPQSLRFMLGNGIWYKPDFILHCPTMGLAAFECKGPHSFRGGFENLKVAAHKYPFILWTLVWKEGGQWKEQIVLP